jgi:hypothetical protein
VAGLDGPAGVSAVHSIRLRASAASPTAAAAEAEDLIDLKV